jgi:hypothetical protein
LTRRERTAYRNPAQRQIVKIDKLRKNSVPKLVQRQVVKIDKWRKSECAGNRYESSGQN